VCKALSKTSQTRVPGTRYGDVEDKRPRTPDQDCDKPPNIRSGAAGWLKVRPHWKQALAVVGKHAYLMDGYKVGRLYVDSGGATTMRNVAETVDALHQSRDGREEPQRNFPIAKSGAAVAPRDERLAVEGISFPLICAR
jgi:hypothetical protein